MSDIAKDRVDANDAEETEQQPRRAVKTTEIEEGDPWNTIEAAFLKRRSIRRFKKKAGAGTYDSPDIGDWAIRSLAGELPTMEVCGSSRP